MIFYREYSRIISIWMGGIRKVSGHGDPPEVVQIGLIINLMSSVSLSFLKQKHFPLSFTRKESRAKKAGIRGGSPYVSPFQLAKLSPSALCASGLRTLLAKVKNIFDNSLIQPGNAFLY
jgi:hypothetical protein